MKDGLETRLHVVAPLIEGATVAVSEPQAHYLRNVLRLGPGDDLALFNGCDGEWRARIETAGKKAATLSLIERTRPQRDEPDVWLVFAPIKRARIDFVAQKATELGVSRLWPVMTRRTMVDRVNIDRMTANAIEAAEQSDRLTIPEVRDPEKLDRVLDDWPADRPLILCDETHSGRPLADALSDGQFSSNKRVGFVIGPEGGFAEEELDRLRSLPFVTPVSLGPRLLRADTAALAVVAAWQTMAGDWR
jgi:16S rRNA (uracil1498-N3)-methyltransferase